MYSMSGTAVKNQCTTQSCTSYSSLLLDTINRSVDPCQSFTRFVCDGWKQKPPLSVREIHIANVLGRVGAFRHHPSLWTGRRSKWFWRFY
ncbi:hypothetical protein MTO96_006342 [Rhipicephalus appendiculatus]